MPRTNRGCELQDRGLQSVSEGKRLLDGVQEARLQPELEYERGALQAEDGKDASDQGPLAVLG
jgi:hypothetical protein